LIFGLYIFSMDTNTKDWVYEEFVVWMSFTIANTWSWVGGPIDTPLDQRIIYDEGNTVLRATFKVLEQIGLTKEAEGGHIFLVKAEELRPAIRRQIQQGPSFERLFSRVLWLDEHYSIFGERDGVLNFRREGIHLRDALIELGYVFPLGNKDTDCIAGFAWTFDIEPIFREAGYMTDTDAALSEQAELAMDQLEDSVVLMIRSFKLHGDTDIAIRRFRLEAGTEFSVAKYAVEQLV